MKSHMIRIAASFALASLMVGGALAQHKPKPKAKVVDCPVCHMPLAAKKDKDHPVAVRLKKGGKVMYCCAGCKMPKSMIVPPKKHKGK